MAVPTTISDLSATASSNSPVSGDTPAEGDDFLRALGAFIRQIHDGDLGDYFKVTSDGRVYGTALHNNAGAVTGTTNQYVASGTYTPTLTGTTNVASSSANACQWMRVGNVVNVSGSISVDPTSGSALTEIEVSLPIASNLTAASQLRGTAARVSSGSQYLVGICFGDATNDTCSLQFYCDSDATSATWSFTFQYVVL